MPQGEVDEFSTPSRVRATPQGGDLETRFWEIVKMGFAHKRKKLSGNLKNIISFKETRFSKFADKRAEDLTLGDWILLSK